MSGTKLCVLAEQKMVGTFGLWVVGIPSLSAKRSEQNKNEWNKNCVS